MSNLDASVICCDGDKSGVSGDDEVFQMEQTQNRPSPINNQSSIADPNMLILSSALWDSVENIL